MRTLNYVIFCALISIVSGSKILAIFPFASHSHYAIGEATMKALAASGHEITIISAMKTKKPMENFKEIIIPDAFEIIMKGQKFNAFDFAKMMPYIFTEFFLFNAGKGVVELMMEEENVKELMNSNEKFDAVFVEIFAADALLGFGQHFNCPVVGVMTFDAVYWTDVYTGNPSPFSFVPMVFYGLADEMNFKERLANTVFSLFEKVLYNLIHLPNQRKLYDKYFPNAKASFDEIHKNVSLVFINSHVSSSAARPLMPNMIPIGGIHVEPAKQLPQDIQEFLDSATDGVILFSMGSAVQSTDWTPERREAFVKVFGKLKQKVLWKYENETLPGNPGNIKIGKWIPQRDILAHKNVKIFITHGGQLGTTEAVCEGVPLLVIPLFGDQVMNANRAVFKGYALTLNFEEITEESLEKVLNELLTNPKYENNSKRLSKVYKDRPMSPKETIVYWTEHIIRHQGADHLKSVARKLSYIEYNLLDVYATLIGGFLISFYLLVKFLKKICKRKDAGKSKNVLNREKKHK